MMSFEWNIGQTKYLFTIVKTLSAASGFSLKSGHIQDIDKELD